MNLCMNLTLYRSGVVNNNNLNVISFNVEGVERSQTCLYSVKFKSQLNVKLEKKPPKG